MPCLSLLLEAGYQVDAVHPVPGPPDYRGVTWHVADLMDPTQVRALMQRVRPSHLLHLAWYVAPGEYWRSPENLRWVAASLDLARTFAEAGGMRAVMVGTCAEYQQSEGPRIAGVTPLRPTTVYGAAKAAVHLAAGAYLRDQGVGFAWGHVFYLFGERENEARLVPSAIRAFHEGVPFSCEHPGEVRDFLPVRDVAGAFVALLDSAVEGDVNIASGDPVSIGDLVAEIAAIMDRPELAVRPPDESPGSPVVADTSRLTAEVGWTPTISRHDALKATVAWWVREHGRSLRP